MQKSDKVIHLLAFDIPFPADYGGVIDIYYKIEALHNMGISVILHCYQYGRKPAAILKKICSKVYYYPRRTFKNPFYGTKPYIVNSRNSSELLENLLKDTYPILFEGLHCTYHLPDKSLKARFKIVRMHNIEHHYYRHLEKLESRYFKKYFFRIEAEKLKRYESILKHASLIAAISPNDTAYLQKKFNHVMYLPAFHSNTEYAYPGRKGKYILYHGNLAVAENYDAAMQLTLHVFSKLKDVHCVIAGNNPPGELVTLVERYPNISIRTHLQTEELHQLISEAHINVLHTNQNTGIKLKLLNALYRGKFAITNNLMVDNTGLEELCVTAQNFEEMQHLIREYMMLEYTEAYFENRIAVLKKGFSNEQTAMKLSEQVNFDHTAIQPHRKSETSKRQRLPLFSAFMSYFLP